MAARGWWEQGMGNQGLMGPQFVLYNEKSPLEVNIDVVSRCCGHT